MRACKYCSHSNREGMFFCEECGRRLGVSDALASLPTRDEALARMQLALRNCTIEGVSTSIGIHAEIMRDDAFRAGGVSTAFLPAFLARARPASSRKVD